MHVSIHTLKYIYIYVYKCMCLFKCIYLNKIWMGLAQKNNNNFG